MVGDPGLRLWILFGHYGLLWWLRDTRGATQAVGSRSCMYPGSVGCGNSPRAWCCVMVVWESVGSEEQSQRLDRSPHTQRDRIPLLSNQNSHSRIIMGRQGMWQMCDLNSPGNAHLSVWDENVGMSLPLFIPTSLNRHPAPENQWCQC